LGLKSRLFSLKKHLYTFSVKKRSRVEKKRWARKTRVRRKRGKGDTKRRGKKRRRDIECKEKTGQNGER
jgi:hypothetical protein